MRLPEPPAFLAKLGRHVPTSAATLPLMVGFAAMRRIARLQAPEELEGRRFALVVEDLVKRATIIR